ncbi:MAG TPA: transglycosylase family protein, partial [Acidimicrobiales bacterium]|nr:transglycosylase family protein [Acidimicrobiales bacterium]
STGDDPDQLAMRLTSAALPTDQNLLLADGEAPDAGADRPAGTRDMEAPWSWVSYESGKTAVPAAPVVPTAPPPPPPVKVPRPVVAAARVVPAAVTSHRATTTGVWAALRHCESGGDYSENTGNGYYGAYQFSLGTWRGLGLAGLPSQASPAAQDQAAQRLQARSGWGQWPSCSRRLRLT